MGGMKMKKKLAFLMLLLLVLSLALTSCSSPAPAEESPEAGTESEAEEAGINKDDYFITVATGPTSGLYFPIGGAFSNVIKNKLGYRSSAQSTGASVENINLMKEAKADMAITMADAIAQAYEGTGAFEGKEPMKTLYLLVE